MRGGSDVVAVLRSIADVSQFPPLPVPTAVRRRPRAVATLLAAVTVAVGCGRDADVRPGDIRVYTIAKDAEPQPVVATPQDQPSTAGKLAYDLPEGWSDAGAGGMRLATLLIGDPDDKREVTVIPASGSLEGNVERWQGQLDPQAATGDRGKAVAAAVADAETVDVNGTPAKVVMLLNAAEDQAILGAMIPRGEASALFVKFKGDAAVARRERDNFVRFVTSIRWNETP